MADGQSPQVLCAIDYSSESEIALGYACVLADKLGAQLTALHAVRLEPPLEFTSAQVEELVNEMEGLLRDSEAHLREYIREKCKGGNVTCKVIDSAPVEAILDESAAIDADYIVMGTTGKSGLKRALMGSVAEGVAGRSSVPLLAVRDKAHSAGQKNIFERILVPVDFSEPAREAARIAASLARTFGAKLIVAHFVGPGDDEENARERLMQQAHLLAPENAKLPVCDWVPRAEVDSCEYELIVRKGEPSEQTVQLAADMQADLVVLPAVHQQTLKAAVIGTVSDRVMRTAPCPVLLVPVRS